MQRRDFIKIGGLGASALASGWNPLLNKLEEPKVRVLNILHTNDVHSRIEPFPLDGGRFQGLGGAAKRAALIQQIRDEGEPVLLLDSGDIFQGTPYFNFFGGELEFKLMSKMGYDAATIGNHDFDAGIEGLAKQMPNADFTLINCNYDFKNTIMDGQVVPYKIFQKGKIKVGVLGVGIKLDGLVPKTLTGETKYLDPIECANDIARILVEEHRCDLVICLSHLGFQYRSDRVSDVSFAPKSKNIDIILGGHTHTFLDEPHIVKNADNQDVMISQVGWGGIALGRLRVEFEYAKPGSCITCGNTMIG